MSTAAAIEAGDKLGTDLVFENELVSVWDFTLAPGEETAMHTHRHSYIWYALRGGPLDCWDVNGEPLGVFDVHTGDVFDIKCLGNGQLEVMSGEAKGMLFPDTHVAKNAGDTPYREILIEFRQPVGPGQVGDQSNAGSGVGSSIIYENEVVRVWDFVLMPGESTPMHTHTCSYMWYAIHGNPLDCDDADGNDLGIFEVQTDEVFEIKCWGEQLEVMSENGKGTLFPATHKAMNAGKTPYREILIEFKQ